MKLMKNHCKKGKTVSRIAGMILAAFLLAAAFSGCTWSRTLRLPQLREFQQSVSSTYPDAKVSCKYSYGAGVMITVRRSSFDPECVYTILGDLKPIVCDENFIEDLFTLFEKEAHGDHNWELGERPVIYLYFEVGGNARYQFSTRATLEGYNSAYDPDSYTWDGYTTWYGTEIVNDEYLEISPEEIEEAVKRYSQD